jgi:hypothetical protein
MRGRFSFTIVSLVGFLVAGTLTEACQAGAVPTSGIGSPTAADLPTMSPSPSPSVAWLLDGANHAVAIDPQTGKMLSRTPSLYSYFWFYGARHEPWQYYVQLDQHDEAWQIGLAAVDGLQGQLAPTIPLDAFALTSTNEHESVGFPELFVSPDGRRVFVILAGKIDLNWVTRVYVVDLKSRTAATITVFESGNDPWGPDYRAVLSTDGSRLFIAQNSASAPGDAIQTTRIGFVNTTENKIERVLDAPGNGAWSLGAVSADGRALYLMQPMKNGAEEAGYRFLVLDVNGGTVGVRNEFTDSGSAKTGCGYYSASFTPDGHALWIFCPDSVDFLDPQTGRTVGKVLLGEGGLAHFNLTYWRLSPDNKLLYVLFTSTNQLSVVDLAQRVLARQATFKEQKSFFGNPLEWLAQLFVNTASAKMAPEPGLVLSRDGQRLYFVDVEGIDSGDGVLGVDTATLKPIGHWLKGKDIIGIQLSADERELFAFGEKDRTLYVLDAATGEIRGGFANVVKEPSGLMQER